MANTITAQVAPKTLTEALDDIRAAGMMLVINYGQPEDSPRGELKSLASEGYPWVETAVAVADRAGVSFDDCFWRGCSDGAQ